MGERWKELVPLGFQIWCGMGFLDWCEPWDEDRRHDKAIVILTLVRLFFWVGGWKPRIPKRERTCYFVVAFNQINHDMRLSGRYWGAPPPDWDVCSFSQVLLCILGVLYGCDAWMKQLLKADLHYGLMSGFCNNTFGQSNSIYIYIHYAYYIPSSLNVIKIRIKPRYPQAFQTPDHAWYIRMHDSYAWYTWHM